MRASRLFLDLALPAVLLLPATSAIAQGTPADYERANGLRAKYEGLTVNVPGPATWINKIPRFWYRRSVRGGNEFIVYDADTRQKRAAFDHQRLATALSTATGNKYTATTLPFDAIAFVDEEKSLDVSVDGGSWTCLLADYACRKADPRRRVDDTKPRVSPDKRWETLVSNYNVAIRAAGTQKATLLSFDGSEGNAYELTSIAWSPDDQLQPKHSSLRYAKPGDVLDVEQPVVFDIASKTQLVVTNGLFPNAYALSRLAWRKDSPAVTFEYNQRGHQVYRVIEIDAATGTARAAVSEERRAAAYGEHKRFDFFVRHLLGLTPPEWTKKDQKASTADPEPEVP